MNYINALSADQIYTIARELINSNQQSQLVRLSQKHLDDNKWDQLRHLLSDNIAELNASSQWALIDGSKDMQFQ